MSAPDDEIKVGDLVRAEYWRDNLDGLPYIGALSNGNLVLELSTATALVIHPKDAVKVEPRPTVRESWGFLNAAGVFDCRFSEKDARASAAGWPERHDLARCAALTITDEHVGRTMAVICDEHRVPLPAERDGGAG